jgi:hypothetical protein
MCLRRQEEAWESALQLESAWEWKLESAWA